MGRSKSFVTGSLAIDHAKRAHNCQHSKAHRISRGTPRLKVKVGRSTEHYCLACALKFVASDIEKLKKLEESIRQALASPNE